MKDAVDDLIEQAIRRGAVVEFVDDGLLKGLQTCRGSTVFYDVERMSVSIKSVPNPTNLHWGTSIIFIVDNNCDAM